MILKNFGLRFKFDFLQDCFFLYLVFFFFLEKFTPHSLTRFQKPEKKNMAGSKKTAFSLTHSIFAEKSGKTNFSGKKKNTIPLS